MSINITWVDTCSGEESIDRLSTPVCLLKIYRKGDVVTQVEWDFSKESYPNTDTRNLAEFWPDSDKLVNLKLLKQGTAHQNKVWAELLTIPQGSTLTYSAIAKKVGSSPRAVGNACRDNPYTLIIPCHRVVSVNGLGGYSGQRHGEYMKIKEKLLAYEAKNS